MQDLMQTLVYSAAGYGATYMVLRPAALIDAVSIGPGMGAGGWEYHLRHWKMTFPVLLLLIIVLMLALAQIPSATR